MSDPIAVAILAKLSAWYSFDGNLNDSHGIHHLTSGGAGASGYSAGLHDQQIDAGSRAYHTIASPPAVSPTTGNFTVGGWFNYTTGVAARPEFGLSYGGLSGDEALTIVVNPDGFFYLQTFISSSEDDPVADPLSGAINYPLTFRVQDSLGQLASSNQAIRIVSGGELVPGRYFVVGTWDDGARILYMDSIAVASKPSPASVNIGSFPRIGIGRTGDSNASCITDLDECFVCLNATLTPEEISWLYNEGAGRSYEDVEDAAA